MDISIFILLFSIVILMNNEFKILFDHMTKIKLINLDYSKKNSILIMKLATCPRKSFRKTNKEKQEWKYIINH